MNQNVVLHPILAVAIIGVLVSVAGWILLRLRELEIAKANMDMRLDAINGFRNDICLLRVQIEALAKEQVKIATILDNRICEKLSKQDEGMAD